MKRGIRAVASRIRKRDIIIGTALLLLASVVFAGWYYLQQASLRSRADTGSAMTIVHLESTARHLKATFGQTQDTYDSGANTKMYLGILEDLQAHCKSLQSYTTKDAGEKSDALRQYLSKGKELCQELTKLAQEANAITTPLLPVLTIATPAKQYQTLPIISNLVRSGHEKAIADALTQTKSTDESVAFPTKAKTQLAELQSSVSTNPGLAYFPALSSFQYEAYGERQRYWNDYADLSNLIRALAIYRERHCLLVTDDTHFIPACRQQ